MNNFLESMSCVLVVGVLLFAAFSLRKVRRSPESTLQGPAKPGKVHRVGGTDYVMPYPQSAVGEVVKQRVMDTVPAWLHDPKMQEEWRKQDVLAATAEVFAAMQGCVTDQYVKQSIQEIKHLPACQQYDAYDVLWTQVINGHAHGMAASVLNDVSRAWDESVK